MSEETAHEDGDNYMRSLQLSVWPRRTPGPGRREPKAAIRAGRHAAKSGKPVVPLARRVLAFRIGLPDLDHRIRHAGTIAVDHTATNRDERPGEACVHELVVEQRAQANMEERSDGLRSRPNHHSSQGVISPRG